MQGGFKIGCAHRHVRATNFESILGPDAIWSPHWNHERGGASVRASPGIRAWYWNSGHARTLAPPGSPENRSKLVISKVELAGRARCPHRAAISRAEDSPPYPA